MLSNQLSSPKQSKIQNPGKIIFWVFPYLLALGWLWKKLQPLGAEAGPFYLIGLYLVFFIVGFFGLIGIDRGVNGKPVEPYIKHLSITIGFLIMVALVGVILASLLVFIIPAVFN